VGSATISPSSTSGACVSLHLLTVTKAFPQSSC
jgi:hypothetical protein